MAEILLASGSPQRRAILEELGMAYRVCPVAVEEVVCATPEETVLANARRKLLAALPLASAGQGVLAADTVVSCDGRILGKPGTPARAAEFLAKLGGRTSCTWTGVALALGGGDGIWLGSEAAEFRCYPLSREEIEWYVSTGEPLERAGAIGISHYGECLVTGIRGSYSCIAGLPKRTLLAILGSSRRLSEAFLPVPPPVIPDAAGCRWRREAVALEVKKTK